MAATFTIKQNDLLPEIVATCLDASNAPFDLTTATGVEFHMVAVEGGAAKVNAAGSIVDATNGIVKYVWAGTDTDTVGDYLAEFEVTFPTSKPLTFPNFENILVTVFDDLA